MNLNNDIFPTPSWKEVGERILHIEPLKASEIIIPKTNKNKYEDYSFNLFTKEMQEDDPDPKMIEIECATFHYWNMSCVMVPYHWMHVTSDACRKASAFLYIGNKLRVFGRIEHLRNMDHTIGHGANYTEFQLVLDNLNEHEADLATIVAIHRVATNYNSCISGDKKALQKWLFPHFSGPPVLRKRIKEILDKLNKDTIEADWVFAWDPWNTNPCGEQPLFDTNGQLTREMLEELKLDIESMGSFKPTEMHAAVSGRSMLNDMVQVGKWPIRTQKEELDPKILGIDGKSISQKGLTPAPAVAQLGTVTLPPFEFKI